MDAKFTSTADKISFVSDNTKMTANLEIQGHQPKTMEETINELETTVKEIAQLANENEKAINDLEQYSRCNRLILHGCQDIPKKESIYAEF